MSEKEYIGDMQPTVPKIDYDTRHKDIPGPGQYEIPTLIAAKEVLSSRRTEVFFKL